MMARCHFVASLLGQIVLKDVNLAGIPPQGGDIAAPSSVDKMQVFVIPGVSHGSKMIALHEELRIQQGASVLASPDVAKRIAKFIVKPVYVDQEN